jgi:hypothetical protein
MKEICKNCDYWDFECKGTKDRPDKFHGICLKAIFDGDNDYRKSPMIVMDSPGYWAGFFTLPDFSCKCFKAKSVI